MWRISPAASALLLLSNISLSSLLLLSLPENLLPLQLPEQLWRKLWKDGMPILHSKKKKKDIYIIKYKNRSAKKLQFYGVLFARCYFYWFIFWTAACCFPCFNCLCLNKLTGCWQYHSTVWYENGIDIFILLRTEKQKIMSKF